MNRALLVLSVILLWMIGAHAQPAPELTLFSNPGFSGAQFTVTGPRTKLSIPFKPRSAIVKGGGAWEVCRGQDYKAGCVTISSKERDLQMGLLGINSARPLGMSADPWREVARLNVRDRAEQDTARIGDGGSFTQIMVCAERNTVRLRRAEVQLSDQRWQRLFVPLALDPGKCSKGIDLLNGPRQIRAVRFDYEAWSPGFTSGTIVVKALPHVEVQPR